MAVLRYVPLGEILIDEGFNTRKNGVGDLTDLTESIKKDGILIPLLGREIGDGKVDLYAGFRRFAVAQTLGIPSVPVMVGARDGISRQGMLQGNIIENIQRESLNPVDEAYALARLQEEFGMSTDEICASLGLRKARVIQRFSLLKVAPSLLEAVHRGDIPMAAALDINRLPADKQDKYLQAAKKMNGEKLRGMIDKELEKIRKQADLIEKPEEPPQPLDPAQTGENVKLIKKATSVICMSLKYEEPERARVKAIDFKPMETDDIQVLARFFDDCASQVEEDIDINEKAEEAIVGTVEGGADPLRIESPIVRQALIKAMANRARELALEKAAQTKKRAKVTFAIAKEVIEEFFGE